MKIIRVTLSDVSNIHMSQSGRVKRAAAMAHQRNQTRSSRSYQKVNRSIAHRVNESSLT